MSINYQGHIQPNHVYLINLIITFILGFIFFIFHISYNIATSWSSDFCPQYLVLIFLFISRNLDILVMQADRFIAVYWSLHYKGLMTNYRAISCCVLAKERIQRK